MAKPHKLAKFNRFSIGRAAVLIGRGKSTKEVANYYFERYGTKWGIGTPEQMGKYLFGKHGGNRPQFRKLADSVRNTYKELLSKQQELVTRSSQHLKRLHQEPGFKQRHAERSRDRLKRMHSDPKFRIRLVEARRKPAARARTSESIKKRAKDPAYREKVSKSLKRRWKDPHYRARMTALAKNRWQQPEYREMQTRRLRARWSELAARARQSEKIRQHWQDPEWRRQWMALSRYMFTRPEIREIWSNAAKKRWQNSEYRQTQLDAIRRAAALAKTEGKRNQTEKGQRTAFDTRTSKWIRSTTKRPETEVIQAEEHARLMNAIQTLSQTELEAVTSIYFLELPKDQVTQQMGITPDALREILASAYKRMFKALRPRSS